MRLNRIFLSLAAVGALTVGACGGGADFTQTCESSADCFEGYACAEETAGATEKVCFRFCDADGDCLTSQYCDIPSGQNDGVCRWDDRP